MCIVCRGREEQSKLLRLQCKEQRIVPFEGEGRSFYLCANCLDNKKLSKALARICKTTPSEALKMLKEIIDNG